MKCLRCNAGCLQEEKSGKSDRRKVRRMSTRIEKFFGHRKHSNITGVFLPDLMNSEQNDEMSDTTGDAMKNKSWKQKNKQ